MKGKPMKEMPKGKHMMPGGKMPMKDSEMGPMHKEMMEYGKAKKGKK